MSNIATNIVQSNHLLALGLDPKTADMVYLFEDKEYPCVLKEPDYLDGDDTLAWSLSALLEVMPKENEPAIVKSLASGQYFVHGYLGLEKSTYMTNDCIQPIDAAYEMVCWLLEQGLIKKGEQ